MADDTPTSRTRRLASAAKLGGRLAWSKLTGSASNREAIDLEMATIAAQTLGQMRGLAAKAGQMFSYVDGLIAEPSSPIYEKVLGTLRAAAPPMSSERARAIVVRELNQPIEAVFSDWSDAPLASASLGQVHRAQLADGSQVVVKVQFPGVAEAVRNDLANVGTMKTLLGPLAGRLNVPDQIAEVRERFLEEIDYTKEAVYQTDFRNLLGHLPHARVPRVFEAFSTRSILTSEYAPGTSFELACAGTPELRRTYAEAMWRFVFTGILRHGRFNADPHPGNYLFEADGTVWFLDFGCTRVLPPHRLALAQALHRALIFASDEEVVARAFAMLDLPHEGRLAEIMGPLLLRTFSPFRRPGAFHLTKSFTRTLNQDFVKDGKAELLRATFQGFKGLPRELLFFNRLQLGFYSVLARLDVPVDYHAIHAEIMRDLDRG